MEKNYETSFSKSRIEAFTDAIFAVILTLLVLEIKVPEIKDHNSGIELLGSLILLIPKILSWVVSFLIVCVIWVNHNRIFNQLKAVTHAIFWLNANLLLWCALIPFPTALLGDYINNPTALIIFGVILSLVSASFYFLRLNILKNHNILNENVDLIHYKKATTNSLLFGPTLYLSGAALSLINPYIGFIIYFIIPLYFIFFYHSSKIIK